MSKEKKKNNNNNNSPSNKYSQLSKENEIIEEIINNPLLLKDIEDLEEEEDEDSYSEKDKITQEILDNKLSFIISEENDQKESKSNSTNKKSKIHKDIVENLLIDLFEYHYNDISTEKKINLGNKIFESKYHIEYFCKNLNKNFSKYILLILDQKIYELIEYVEKLIDTKVKTVKDILEIKNSLKLTGNDIDKIFEKPFEKTMSFDISSILIVLFISDILSDNKINLTDQEYEQIVQAESFDEKEKFEKYIEECKLLFEKIENGENDDDIEVYYEEENENKENREEIELINNNKENDNDENNNVEFDEEKKDEIVIKENKKDNIINNNKKEEKIQNNNIEKKEDIKISQNNNDKNDNIINNNSIKEEKNNNNNINNNDNNSNDKNSKNNVEKKPENYSNIEDLVKYINGNDIKKKKKKKRKKKAKVEQINKEDKDNNIIDDVFENFKSNLIHFSDNLEKVKKIKPKISEAFIEKLKLMNKIIN